MSGFDWPAMLRAGIGGLHLQPRDFWALTPAELLMMLGLDRDTPPVLDRARLNELSRQFPDKRLVKENRNGNDRGRSGGAGCAGGRP